MNMDDQKRIEILEAELEQAANALQKAHPIGQVKAIGLREVGLAAEQVAEMMAEAKGHLYALISGIGRLIATSELDGQLYADWNMALMAHGDGKPSLEDIIDDVMTTTES
jgi:hypothetical protein